MHEHKNYHGENKRTHLLMIQGIINRMSGNLFFLKGWAVTLIVGLFAASITFEGAWQLQMILVGIFIFFWGFDAYFLSLEKSYRDLYNSVREKTEKDIDFAMEITEQKKYAKNTWFASLLSHTLIAFYPSLAIAMLIIINHYK